MIKYILKRISISVVTIFVITFILFLMLDLMPGSPFNDDKITNEQREIINEKYGLDKPILERFVKYTSLMVQGDFGVSYNIQKDAKVSSLLQGRVSTSFTLGAQAVVVGSLVGAVLGIVASLKHNTWIDTLTSTIAVAGVSIPSYVFALALVYVVAFQWRWVPVLWDNSRQGLSSILPVISLSMFTIATVSRFLRSEMLEVLNSDYIQLARSKGLSEGKTIIRHGIRNALIPVITVLGPLVVNLMTGSLVVEKIFGIPGLGELFINAIQFNDYNIVMAIAFLYSVMFIVVMLVVDILYGVIDPRIRLAKGER